MIKPTEMYKGRNKKYLTAFTVIFGALQLDEGGSVVRVCVVNGVAVIELLVRLDETLLV